MKNLDEIKMLATILSFNDVIMTKPDEDPDPGTGTGSGDVDP